MAKQSALRDDGSTALWRKIRSRVLIRDQHTCQRCGMEAKARSLVEFKTTECWSPALLSKKA